MGRKVAVAVAQAGQAARPLKPRSRALHYTGNGYVAEEALLCIRGVLWHILRTAITATRSVNFDETHRHNFMVIFKHRQIRCNLCNRALKSGCVGGAACFPRITHHHGALWTEKKKLGPSMRLYFEGSSNSW